MTIFGWLERTHLTIESRSELKKKKTWTKKTSARNFVLYLLKIQEIKKYFKKDCKITQKIQTKVSKKKKKKKLGFFPPILIFFRHSVKDKKKKFRLLFFFINPAHQDLKVNLNLKKNMHSDRRRSLQCPTSGYNDNSRGGASANSSNLGSLWGHRGTRPRSQVCAFS